MPHFRNEWEENNTFCFLDSFSVIFLSITFCSYSFSALCVALGFATPVPERDFELSWEDFEDLGHLEKRLAHDSKGMSEEKGFMCLSKINKYIVPYGEVEKVQKMTDDGKPITLFKSYSISLWAHNYFVLWKELGRTLREQFGYYPKTGFIRNSIHQITVNLTEAKEKSELNSNMSDLFMFNEHLVPINDLKKNGYGHFVLNSITKKRREMETLTVPNLRCAMKSFEESIKLRRTDAHEYKEKFNYDKEEARELKVRVMYPDVMRNEKPEQRDEIPRFLKQNKSVKTHDTIREKISDLVEELRNIDKLVFMDYVHLGLVLKDLEALLAGGSNINRVSKSLPFLVIPEAAMQLRIPDVVRRNSTVDSDTDLYADEVRMMSLKGNLKEKIERQCPRQIIYDYYFCAATTETIEEMYYGRK